ncbi:MAG: SurA N-terminal domain-containing protein [Pseudomonadota bacterium]
MLDALRKGAGTWVAKIFIGVLMLSFAVWGINDIFTGYRGDALVTVGKTEVHGETFRTAFQSQIQRLSQQVGRPVTNQEARALGLDGQIVGQLVTQAIMDEKGREVGLSMTDEAVANSILTDPNLTGGGSFNRLYFENLLRQIGISEQQFAAERRIELVRQALGEAVVSGIPAPESLNKAIFDYAREERAMDYFAISAASLPEIEPPTAGELTEWFNGNAARYAAPEFRKLGIISLQPSEIADPEGITDEEARADYDARPDQFGQAERRRIAQIVFQSLEEAQAARARIDGGEILDDIATERGLTPDSIDLGLMGREDILDPAVGEAAFSLENGAVSDPIDGQFGTTLVQVREIIESDRQDFDDVKGDIKQRLSERRSEERVLDLYDVIEDARAGGELLSEIARANDLTFLTVDAVDASGNKPDGTPLEDVPAMDALLRDAYESDVGIENDPIQLRGSGFVWYEVLDVEQPRDRTLDEVRDRAERDWIAERQAAQLGDVTREALDALEGGDSILEVARRYGASVTTARGISRFGTERPAGISQAVVERLFGLSDGQFGDADSENEGSRIVMALAGRTTPPYDTTDEAVQQTEQRVEDDIGVDLLEQYVSGLRDRYEIDINGQLLAELLGDRPPQHGYR